MAGGLSQRKPRSGPLQQTPTGLARLPGAMWEDAQVFARDYTKAVEWMGDQAKQRIGDALRIMAPDPDPAEVGPEIYARGAKTNAERMEQLRALGQWGGTSIALTPWEIPAAVSSIGPALGRYAEARSEGPIAGLKAAGGGFMEDYEQRMRGLPFGEKAIELREEAMRRNEQAGVPMAAEIATDWAIPIVPPMGPLRAARAARTARRGSGGLTRSELSGMEGRRMRVALEEQRALGTGEIPRVEGELAVQQPWMRRVDSDEFGGLSDQFAEALDAGDMDAARRLGDQIGLRREDYDTLGVDNPEAHAREAEELMRRVDDQEELGLESDDWLMGHDEAGGRISGVEESPRRRLGAETNRRGDTDPLRSAPGEPEPVGGLAVAPEELPSGQRPLDREMVIDFDDPDIARRIQMRQRGMEEQQRATAAMDAVDPSTPSWQGDPLERSAYLAAREAEEAAAANDMPRAAEAERRMIALRQQIADNAAARGETVAPAEVPEPIFPREPPSYEPSDVGAYTVEELREIQVSGYTPEQGRVTAATVGELREMAGEEVFEGFSNLNAEQQHHARILTAEFDPSSGDATPQRQFERSEARGWLQRSLIVQARRGDPGEQIEPLARALGDIEDQPYDEISNMVDEAINQSEYAAAEHLGDMLEWEPSDWEDAGHDWPDVEVSASRQRAHDLQLRGDAHGARQEEMAQMRRESERHIEEYEQNQEAAQEQHYEHWSHERNNRDTMDPQERVDSIEREISDLESDEYLEYEAEYLRDNELAEAVGELESWRQDEVTQASDGMTQALRDGDYREAERIRGEEMFEALEAIGENPNSPAQLDDWLARVVREVDREELPEYAGYLIDEGDDLHGAMLARHMGYSSATEFELARLSLDAGEVAELPPPGTPGLMERASLPEDSANLFMHRQRQAFQGAEHATRRSDAVDELLAGYQANDSQNARRGHIRQFQERMGINFGDESAGRRLLEEEVILQRSVGRLEQSDQIANVLGYADGPGMASEITAGRGTMTLDEARALQTGIRNAGAGDHWERARGGSPSGERIQPQRRPEPTDEPEEPGGAPWAHRTEAQVNQEQRESLLRHFDRAREENAAQQEVRDGIRQRREGGGDDDVTASILLGAGLGGLAAGDDEPGAGALAGIGILGAIKGRPKFRPTGMKMRTLKKGDKNVVSGKVFEEIPDEEIADIIAATEDASLGPEGLTLKMKRWQHPEQRGNPTIRGGVFYTPEPRMPEPGWGNSYRGHDSGVMYGGSVRRDVEKTYRKPLMVEGTTGGPVPENAYNAIKRDPDAHAVLLEEISAATRTLHPMGLEVDKGKVSMLLRKHGVENAEMLVSEIEAATGFRGNFLRYAVQEAIIAQAARDAGFDAIIGIGPRKRRFSEVFDLTDEFYPVVLMGLGGGAGALAMEAQGGLAQ